MAITKIQSGAIPADTIDTTHIGDVGADKITGQVVSSQISDLNVTHAKLHTDMDLSSKTVTLPTLSTLNTTGNVGIGITPRAKLDISQTSNRTSKTGTTRGVLHLQDGDTPASNEITAITFESNSNNASAIIGQTLTNNGSELFFGTSNGYVSGVTNTAMTIDPSGNVGIGTTSPSEKLHIRGINEPSHIRLQRHESDEALDDGDEIGGIEFWANDGSYNSNTSTLRAAIRAETQNTSSGTRLEFWTGNSASTVEERMRIIADGKVGIGTTSPGQMLHIAGSSPQIMLEDTDASGTPYSKISGVNGHIYLQADEGNELASTAIHFKVDAQEYMTLDHTGMLNLKNYGTNAGWEGASSIPSLAINQSDAHRGIALRTVGNSNVGPTVSLERTRASGAETQHADYLGNIRFNGTSGSHMPRVAAGIEAQQRGSVVGGYAPGRLKFMTSSTTATHNGQNPSTGAYTAKAVINPGGDQLINGQFNYHVISGTSAPNVAFQYDFYRATYGHPMKITTAISHWNGGYMSYKEQWIWGFNTAMSNRTVDEYNGGNGSWTISFPTNDIVRVRMNGDASYGYGSGWFIKLEGNLRREYTTA